MSPIKGVDGLDGWEMGFFDEACDGVLMPLGEFRLQKPLQERRVTQIFLRGRFDRGRIISGGMVQKELFEHCADGIGGRVHDGRAGPCERQERGPP